MLLTGSHEKDVLFAEALRHAATRFGAKIVEEREFKDSGGARRTDSGVAEIQRQMPVVTQGAPEHDVLVAADESEVFAGYLPYRTWDARPVAGSAGLVPTTWNAAFDQWGAVQLQNRFTKAFQRSMTAQRHAGLDRGSHDRRGGGPNQLRRCRQDARLHQEPGILGRGLQGPEADHCATGTCNCGSRSCCSTAATPYRCRRRRASCIRSSALDTLGLDRPETKCKLQ